jgi:hypothetical protein
MELGIRVERQRFAILGIETRRMHLTEVAAGVGQEAVGTHQKPGWELAYRMGI